jgi:uncharacterized protein (TIGR02996 family)
MTEEELLADIVAAPGDEAPRQIYADWLSERGDPRGELIQLELSMEKLEGDARAVAAARHAELLREHPGWLPAQKSRFTRWFAADLWLAGETGNFRLHCEDEAAFRRSLEGPPRASVVEISLMAYPASVADRCLALLYQQPPPRLQTLFVSGAASPDALRALGASPLMGQLRQLSTQTEEATVHQTARRKMR